MDHLLTVQEVSKMLGISEATIRQYTYEGYIPHLKIGGAVRFDSEVIEKWEKKRERPKRGPQRIYID